MHLDFDNINYEFDFAVGEGIGSLDFDLDIGVDFGDVDADPSGQGKGKSPKKRARVTGKDDETDEDGMSVEVGRDAGVSSRGRPSMPSGFDRPTGDFDDFDVRSQGGLDDFGLPGPFPDDMGMDIDLGIDFVGADAANGLVGGGQDGSRPSE